MAGHSLKASHLRVVAGVLGVAILIRTWVRGKVTSLRSVGRSRHLPRDSRPNRKERTWQFQGRWEVSLCCVHAAASCKALLLVDTSCTGEILSFNKMFLDGRVFSLRRRTAAHASY